MELRARHGAGGSTELEMEPAFVGRSPRTVVAGCRNSWWSFHSNGATFLGNSAAAAASKRKNQSEQSKAAAAWLPARLIYLVASGPGGV